MCPVGAVIPVRKTDGIIKYGGEVDVLYFYNPAIQQMERYRIFN